MPGVIAEGVGLCYRILCPHLGGLLVSFLPLACYRKGCLFKTTLLIEVRQIDCSVLKKKNLK